MPDNASPGEFGLIDRYFRDAVARSDVQLGIGDDGALVEPPAERGLVQVIDTMVADVHFPAEAPGDAVGHRALAVNLSDLAAMGAEPAWALLSLTLPARDEDWLAGFAQGFSALAATHAVALIGGDTTRGPLTVTVQASGFVDTPLTRAGARIGDRVWVSGDLGSAAGGLHAWQGGWQGCDSDALIRRLLYPAPRVALGQTLVGVATAAIDISDGLLADAGHIAEASAVRFNLVANRLPIAETLTRQMGDTAAREAALRGGDDYELLFTAPAASDGAILAAAEQAGVEVTAIGDVTPGAGVELDGEAVTGGYDHFRGGRDD